MKQPFVSFLMAAHNEEKIIEKPLQLLLKLPYENYEVIVGLDGCTDKTEQIVKEIEKKSSKFRRYNLNIRQGKPAVINRIIKKAKGEIIVIQDADWIFQVKDRESLNYFFSVFKNNKIGGIAESFPVEWDKEKIRRGNLGYKVAAYSSYFWFEFQKDKFTEKKDGLKYLKEPTMFLTNVFRKKLYKENFSLGDDLERTYDIMKQKCDIVIFEDINMPRLVAVYDKLFLRDIFKQKIRTAIARRQVKDEQNIGLMNYYLPAAVYILKRGWKQGFWCGVMMSYWVLSTFFASFLSNFSRRGTKEGWKLRARK